MERLKFPYEKIIFVCNNARKPGERVSCASAGRAGAIIFDKLKAEVQQRGLKGRIRVSKSGCLDLCECGPNLMIFDDKGEKILYSGVTESDVPVIIGRHFPPAV